MSEFDVFFSYSKFAIYRDDGDRHQDDDNWPRLLSELTKENVEQILGRSVEKFYVYSDRPLGEDWTSMLRNVSRAKVLVPILSETYFSSWTCFKEWLAFSTNSEEFGKVSNVLTKRDPDIFPVFRFENTSEDAGNLVGKFLKISLKALKVACEDEGEKFTDLHERHISDWVHRLLKNENALKMSDDAFANDRAGFRGRRAKREIRSLGEAIANALNNEELPAHLTTQLNQLADVSVLALGLDKFKEGGWGFSMGSYFERDQAGEFLKRGRHEVNILVLRALKHVLLRKEFISEVRQTLLMPLTENGTKFTKSPVRDRKEHAVALSSLLNARSELDKELAARVENLSDELSHSPITERWVLDGNGKDNLSDAVIFFDLSARARDYIKEDPDFMEGRIDAGIVEASHKMAQQSLLHWADKSRIFQKFDNEILAKFDRERDVPVIGLSLEDEFELPSSFLSELLSFRLVCSLEEAATAFVRKSNDIHLVSRLTGRFKKAFARLKQVDCSIHELAFFVKIFPVYLLSMKDLVFHASQMSSDIVAHVNDIEKMWYDLVEDHGGLKLGRLMNAASWAASIIHVERLHLQQAHESVREEYSDIWRSIEKVRTDRISALTSSLESSSKSSPISKFDNFVQQSLEIVSADNRLSWLDVDNDLDSLRAIFAFGGHYEDRKAGAPTRLNEAIGLLLVDFNDDTVVSATAGFSAIYIEPIVDSLGLGISTRERLVYELGTTDADLISNLSNSVVKDCWSLDGDDGTVELVDFVRRTAKISDAIGSQKVQQSSDPGKSYRDLLKLKTLSENEFRYVMRVCSRVTADDIVGIENTEHAEKSNGLVQWTFIDVTRWAESGVFGSLYNDGENESSNVV